VFNNLIRAGGFARLEKSPSAQNDPTQNLASKLELDSTKQKAEEQQR
jgi:hypothetical protein